MTVAEYLESLAQTAGLDEESKAGLKKALGNPKFVEEIGKGVKRQDEFNRGMDELKTDKQKVDAQIQQWREWYNTAVTRDAEREEELQRLKASGTTTPATTTTTVTPTNGGLTQKQLDEAQGRMVQIIKQMGRVSSRHAAQFHEELDVDAVEKIALEQGLTVDKAYDVYVKPRIDELAKKDFDERVRLAREEGVREGLSKRDIPGEGEKSFHPIFGQAKSAEATKGMTDGQRATNFAEAWSKAAEAPKH